jgi:hypothetical protein
MKWITWTVLLSFVSALCGCASNEHMTDYYAVEQSRTEAIIASINQQAADRGQRNLQMMQSYSTSIAAAATTPSAADDVAIALAWGYQMGSPDNIEIPRLSPIKAPPTNVDYIRAWSPIIGMAIPFLYPLFWGGGTSGSGSGNSYSADNGGSIILDSGNPGSYNSVGGDYANTITQSDYRLVENCDGCGSDGGPGTDVDPINPIVGGDTCDVSGGYLGPDGRIYADPGFTCSCGSRAEGKC